MRYGRAMLHEAAQFLIAADLLIALYLAVAVIKRPPHMAVMKLVWPLTGLFGGPLALWLYLSYGRDHHKPFWSSVAIDTCHCGAGCTLGDLIAEALAALSPGLLAWFGWGSLFRDAQPAAWVLDTLLAYLFGIAFQYYAIKPMGETSAATALVRALKADTLSILAWQAGMIGVMAWMQYGATAMTPLMHAAHAEYWLMMQAAMLTGFVLAYPVNWWLVKSGIKSEM